MIGDDHKTLLHVRIGPKSAADREALLRGLTRLAEEDPVFRADNDPETGKILLKGRNELHLDTLVDRLFREFGVKAAVEAPRVAYLETIAGEAECAYIHERRSFGRDQYAEVTLAVSPFGREDDFRFDSDMADASLSADFIAAVRRGAESVASAGPLAAAPVVGVRAVLKTARAVEGRSDELSFEVAGRMCLRKAMKQAGRILLEPIMSVEIRTPGDHVGVVIGDLVYRRGVVSREDRSGGRAVVFAMVPLVNLMGYVFNLRSMTGGQGAFEMRFDHYAAVSGGGGPDDDFPMAAAVRA